MSDKKSCFDCKYFEIRDNFHTKTGQKGFVTNFKKCGFEYLIYNDTKENRQFFSNSYCSNWEKKE